MAKETWKDVFCNQVDTGKFWKKMYKDNFKVHLFLDRSDAAYICQKAQADTYEAIIAKLEGKVSEEVINELKEDLQKHWETDESALGVYVDGKQIK